MRSIKTGAAIIQVLCLCAILLLVVGSILGQPMLLSYVETGSMEPTLEPGDGFIAIPLQVDSSIDEGDVVVFRAEELHGGGLTTHRIVDDTEYGYITRGDANPFSDQSGDEPPVKHQQIVAKAFQINGNTVSIPHLGSTVELFHSILSIIQRQIALLAGTSSLAGNQLSAYLFFSSTILWYVVEEWRSGGSKEQSRVTKRAKNTNIRVLLILCSLLLVIGATMAMVVPAGSQQYGVVSADFTSERPNTIPMGESKSRAYPVGNGGVIPVIAYIEPASEGIEVEPQEVRVEGRSVTNATVTLHAPPETGYYRRFIVEHRYLALLPQPVIHGLYQMHPWAPIVAIDALIGVPFYLMGVTLLGTGPVRWRTSSRDTSPAVRLTRLVRNIYR